MLKERYLKLILEVVGKTSGLFDKEVGRNGTKKKDQGGKGEVSQQDYAEWK